MNGGPGAGGERRVDADALREVGAFIDPERFRHHADEILHGIRVSRSAPCHERVRAPGDLEAECEAAYRHDGIPLVAQPLDGVIEAAERLGVDAEPIRAGE